jgi:threonine/homoserine/homoserine lactone efflux protein
MSTDPAAALAALGAGLAVGLLIALEVGPIFLLCARTSARFGFRAGAGIGMGAATADLAYAILGSIGAAVLLQLEPLRLALGLTGAGVLVWFGVRTLRDAFRVRIGGEDDLEVVTPGAAYRTGLVATASNPLTILTWAAVFSGAAVTSIAGSPTAAALFVLGSATGSLISHLALAGAMSWLGARLSTTALRVIDVISGVGLLVFGGILGAKTLSTESAA